MAILPQTNENLTPYVSARQIIEDSPSLVSSRNVVLIGFVQDVSQLPAGTPINEPIYVGTITSVSTAIGICKKYGFRYKPLSDIALDFDNTDEIAAMLILAGMTYQEYVPDGDNQQIDPCQYIIGILDPAINDRENKLFINAGDTPRPFSGGYFLIPQSAGTNGDIAFDPINLEVGQSFVIENLTDDASIFNISINGFVFQSFETEFSQSIAIRNQERLVLTKLNERSFIYSYSLPIQLENETTAYGQFFDHIITQKIPVDLIAQSYEYKEGDSISSVNYLADLKAFSETVYAKGDPRLGRAWALLANIDFRNLDNVGDTLAICNNAYSTTLVYPQDLSASSYQIPSSWLCAALSPILCGAVRPFDGFYGQLLTNIPAPASLSPSDGMVLSHDTIVTLNQYGYSTLGFNTQTSSVFMSRLLVSFFENPVTGLAREFMLDYQDFCITHDYVFRTFARLEASGIINSRYVVLDNGSSEVLSEVDGIAFAEAVNSYNAGMLGVDPKIIKQYKNTFMTMLDKDNLSRIKALSTIAPSTIIYQIDLTTNVENFERFLGTLATNT